MVVEIINMPEIEEHNRPEGRSSLPSNEGTRRNATAITATHTLVWVLVTAIFMADVSDAVVELEVVHTN